MNQPPIEPAGADGQTAGAASAGRWPGAAGHMTRDEFRRAGYAMVDRVAAYWDALTDPARAPAPGPASTPGQVYASMPPEAPEQGEPMERIAADADAIIAGGLTHWQHPAFMGYFPANVSPPAVLAELLSAGLGQQGMLWATSPACTELETLVMDWMARACGLPAAFLSPAATGGAAGVGAGVGGGVIQGTASEAALVAMVAARHAARADDDARGDRPAGHAPPALLVYTTDQAHSSIVKAAVIAGVARSPDRDGDLVGVHGGGAVRLVPTGADQAMDAAALDEAVRADRAAGRRPFFVAATMGTTGVMATDDLAAVGSVCRRHGLWLHADGAFAGSALLCPEHRAMALGLELADSFCFNPHKWLLTNFDCSLLWTRRARELVSSLSVTPEYLRNDASASGRVVDYRDWQVPLGRRFRALKLWFVIRAYGLAGLRAHVREHVRLAGLLAELVDGDARFVRPVPARLSLVCLALRAGEGPTRALLARVNARGRVLLTHAVAPPVPAGLGAGWPGGTVIRAAIGGTFTAEPDVRLVWSELRAAADELEHKP